MIPQVISKCISRKFDRGFIKAPVKSPAPEQKYYIYNVLFVCTSSFVHV